MKKLTREQMKGVMGGDGYGSGGGTCRYHYNVGGYTLYGDCTTKSAAIDGANSAAQIYGNGAWCCDSCVSLGYPAC